MTTSHKTWPGASCASVTATTNRGWLQDKFRCSSNRMEARRARQLMHTQAGERKLKHTQCISLLRCTGTVCDTECSHAHLYQVWVWLTSVLAAPGLFASWAMCLTGGHWTWRAARCPGGLSLGRLGYCGPTMTLCADYRQPHYTLRFGCHFHVAEQRTAQGARLRPESLIPQRLETWALVSGPAHIG